MIRPGTSAQLAFAKLQEVVLEFAGPPEVTPGEEVKAKLWGMVLAVEDIEAAVASLREKGYTVSDPSKAVQPGAKIAAVKGGTSGVPFAVIQYNAIGVDALPIEESV
jgi:predicted enzyme related to lactoylglutathione lyase